jgi:hypothetical protein
MASACFDTIVPIVHTSYCIDDRVSWLRLVSIHSSRSSTFVGKCKETETGEPSPAARTAPPSTQRRPGSSAPWCRLWARREPARPIQCTGSPIDPRVRLDGDGRVADGVTSDSQFCTSADPLPAPKVAGAFHQPNDDGNNSSRPMN